MVSKKPTLKDKHIREYRAFSNQAVQTPINTEVFDVEKETEKTWKAVEKRAALIQKFKSIERFLPPKEVKEYKVQLGLITEDEEGNEKDVTDDTNLPLMLEVLKSEKDPQVRQQLVMALMSKKGGIDSNMMMLAMMMGNQKQSSGDDFKDKLLDEILRDKVLGKKEDSQSSLRDAMETIKLAQEMVGGGGDPLDELIEKKKKMEELGLVGSKGDSLEEKKLDLDYKKFQFEKTRESEREADEAEFKKKAVNEGIKAIPKVLALLKNGQTPQEEPEPEEEPQNEYPKAPIQTQIQTNPQEPPIDVIEKTCNNPECKRRFTITHIDQPRYLICPNVPDRLCNRMYELRKSGELAEYELSGDDLEKAIIEAGGAPLEEEENKEDERNNTK